MENQPLERLVSFEAGSEQTMDVTPLEGNLYRLEVTPVFVEQQLFLGDIIEAETQEDGVLSFRRLVTPSPWCHWQWFLSRATVESPAFEALKEAIEEQGGKWEQVFGGLFFVHLPKESRFDPEAAWHNLRY